MPDECSRPDCGRPRQPYGRYCCNMCSVRHEADLPPGHDPKCARQSAEPIERNDHA